MTIHLSSFQRFALFLFALSGIVWLGGTIVRAAIGFDLFVPGTLTFKADMPPDAQAQTLRLFARASFYTLISYGLVVVLGAWLWLQHKTLWRERGGLFIGGMLVCLYIPIEIWQGYYDILLVKATQYATYKDFPLETAKQLLTKRITILSGAGPFLAMLGYATAVFFLIVQPMRKVSSAE
ncbi:MAG: hypothetical protein EAZ92_05385 [Candidatus Kapaibacterium sp.]|nr:MAG: hypothetical protein EAZ92_05385 [Candidatus Kapabacteria bacterium]